MNGLFRRLESRGNEFYRTLDEKSQRIVKRNLRGLEDDPSPRPGAGRGDREKLVYRGEEAYRMHISRTYTAIYRIAESEVRAGTAPH